MPPRRQRARSRGIKIDYSEGQEGNLLKRAGDESSDEYVEAQPSPSSPIEPESAAEEMDIEVKPSTPQKAKRVKLGDSTTNITSAGSSLAPMPERFQLFFGAEDEQLAQGIITRAKWSQSPVVPIPAAGTTETEDELDILAAECHPQAPELVANDDLKGLAGQDLVIDKVMLLPNEARVCERIIHLNVGFPVSIIRWAPCNDDKQLLAVAVLDDDNGAESSIRPLLSVSQSESLKGTNRILLYSFNTLENRIEQCTEIKWANKGPAREMAWRPARGCKELAIVTCSGDVAVFAVPSTSTSLQLTIPLEAWLQVGDFVTCVSWLDTNTLLIGTSSGLLLEYCLNTGLRSSTRLSFSPVARLVSGFGSSSNSTAVMAITADGYTRVLDLAIPFGTAQALAGRVKAWNMAAGYIPLLNSFVRAEDDFTARLVPMRKPAAAVPALTRHSSAVQSVACSPFHPIVLSGATDGCLRVANAVRRALVPRRSVQASEDAVLWQLQVCDQTGEVRIEERLELQSTGTLAREPSPKRAAITSIDWLPLKHTNASWYAAGTVAGLVRIEKMC